jgi:thiamine biosynthesis protein ThiS
MMIKVNGQERPLPEGGTLSSLLSEQGLMANKVAVELNRRLVRTEKYDTGLKEGDEVEIVTFVGGG